MIGTSRAIPVVGWNLVLILAAVLIAEVIFGSWFFGPSLDFLKVPRNVVVQHDLSRIRPGSDIVVYRKDEFGLRGDYGNPSNVDVLVVGGSTTNEFYIGEGKTWVDVLRAELKRHGKDLAFANSGVDGHSTIGHLRSFDVWYSRIPGLRPSYVLIYAGINDVHVEDHARFDAVEPTAPLQRLIRYAKNNSAVYNLYQTVRGVFRARKVNVVYEHAPPKVREITEYASVQAADYQERLFQYELRLRALAERARNWGAKPIFVTQRYGSAYQRNGIWYATGSRAIKRQSVLSLYNQKMLSVCRNVGGICIDLAGAIKLRATDFSDDMHTNVDGSRKIGIFLANQLKDHI